MRIVAMLILLATLGSAGPSSPRSLLVTTDGTRIQGDIGQDEIVVHTIDEQKVIVPRAALKSLRSSPAGHHEITLKDGGTVEGTIEGDLKIKDGLIERVYPAEKIEEISYDIFVPLSGTSVQEICPIRAEIPIGEIFEKKTKRWRTSRSRLASCERSSVVLMDFTRRKGVLQTRFKAGEEPKKGTELSVRPSVFLAAGEDQYLHLILFLMQGEVEIARASHLYEGDEGEANRFPEMDLWYAPDVIRPDGPEPTLRFQMLTTLRKEERETGTYFWWFTFHF